MRSMTEDRIREAVRYLGYGNHAVDERTLALITDSFRELEEKARVKSVCRIFEVKWEPAQLCRIQIGNMNIESKSLARNLCGCRDVVVFAATLGAEVDLLMKRYQVTDMARAVVWQACAAAYLEEYCDQMQEQIEQGLKEGRGTARMQSGRDMETRRSYLKPRFSPGYGDFDIHHQEEILRMLDAAKTIGLTMTESYMLTPTKSVTAVIGILETAENGNRQNRCLECGKQDCIYRQN